MPAEIDFCGELFIVDAQHPLTIGREGRLVIDDNPYLHRRFLEIIEQDSVIWLANRGSHLSATVSDHAGLMQAWLAPGPASRWFSGIRSSGSPPAPRPTSSR